MVQVKATSSPSVEAYRKARNKAMENLASTLIQLAEVGKIDPKMTFKAVIFVPRLPTKEEKTKINKQAPPSRLRGSLNSP